MPSRVDPSTVAQLVEVLTDPTNAEPARTFPRDRSAARKPGLYAWWADQEGLDALSRELKAPLPSSICAGLAGATHWPSGKKSTATLLSRIRGLHLQSNIRGSTFRHTLAALLAEPLALQIIGPNRLAPESEQQLSAWMKDHLRVVVCAYPDADTLGAMEDAILARLDPPLNLKGMVLSPLRRIIAERRYLLSHPT